jgi:hypothetical protein
MCALFAFDLIYVALSSIVGLVCRLSTSIAPKIRSFKTHNITALMDGFSQLHVASPKLFEECTRVLSQRRSELDARDLATSAAAVVRIALGTKSLKKLEAGQTMHREHIGIAQKYLNVLAPTLKDCLGVRRFDPKSSMRFTSQGLAMTLWAYSQELLLKGAYKLSEDEYVDHVLSVARGEKATIDDLPLFGEPTVHYAEFDKFRVLQIGFRTFCARTNLVTAQPSHLATAASALAATVLELRKRIAALLEWLQACHTAGTESGDRALSIEDKAKLENVRISFETRLAALSDMLVFFNADRSFDQIASTCVRLLSPESSGKEWQGFASDARATVTPKTDAEQGEVPANELITKELEVSRKFRTQATKSTDAALAREAGVLELEDDESTASALHAEMYEKATAKAVDMAPDKPSGYDPLQHEKVAALRAKFTMHDVAMLAEAFASVGLQNFALFDHLAARIARAEVPHAAAFQEMADRKQRTDHTVQEDSLRDMRPVDVALLLNAFVLVATRKQAQQVFSCVADAYKRESSLHDLGFASEVADAAEGANSGEVPDTFDDEATFADMNASGVSKPRLPQRHRPSGRHTGDTVPLSTGVDAVEDGIKAREAGAEVGVNIGGGTTSTWSGRLLTRSSWSTLQSMLCSLSMYFPLEEPPCNLRANDGAVRQDFAELKSSLAGSTNGSAKLSAIIRASNMLEADSVLQQQLPEGWYLPGGLMYDMSSMAPAFMLEAQPEPKSTQYLKQLLPSEASKPWVVGIRKDARWRGGLAPSSSMQSKGEASASNTLDFLSSLARRAKSRLSEAPVDDSESLALVLATRGWRTYAQRLIETGFFHYAITQTLNKNGSISAGVTSQTLSHASSVAAQMLISMTPKTQSDAFDVVAQRRLLSTVHAWIRHGMNKEVQEAYMQIDSVLEKGRVPSRWVPSLHKYFASGNSVAALVHLLLQQQPKEVNSIARKYAQLQSTHAHSEMFHLPVSAGQQLNLLQLHEMVLPAVAYTQIAPTLAQLLLPRAHAGSNKSTLPANPFLRFSAAALVQAHNSIMAPLK